MNKRIKILCLIIILLVFSCFMYYLELRRNTINYYVKNALIDDESDVLLLIKKNNRSNGQLTENEKKMLDAYVAGFIKRKSETLDYENHEEPYTQEEIDFIMDPEVEAKKQLGIISTISNPSTSASTTLNN